MCMQVQSCASRKEVVSLNSSGNNFYGLIITLGVPFEEGILAMMTLELVCRASLYIEWRAAAIATIPV